MYLVTRSDLTKREVIYGLETVMRLGGVRIVPVDPDSIKVLPVADGED